MFVNLATNKDDNYRVTRVAQTGYQNEQLDLTYNHISDKYDTNKQT